jgi:hypothetical protein
MGTRRARQVGAADARRARDVAARSGRHARRMTLHSMVVGIFLLIYHVIPPRVAGGTGSPRRSPGRREPGRSRAMEADGPSATVVA